VDVIHNPYRALEPARAFYLDGNVLNFNADPIEFGIPYMFPEHLLEALCRSPHLPQPYLHLPGDGVDLPDIPYRLLY
jgi:hypothetical protein